MPEVAAAWISVRPDLSGFHRTIQRELHALTPKIAKIGDEWGRELTRGIDRALDRIDGRRLGVRVDTNAAQAAGDVAALDKEIGRLDGRTANVDVDADSAAATAQLAATNAEVSRLDGRRAHVGVFADVAGALAGIASVKGALIGLAVVSTPAIAGIGAGLVGLLGPLAAAGAGFGGLAAVAIPSVVRIVQATKEQEQATKGALGASNAAAAAADAQAGAQQALASAIRNAAAAHQQALEQVRAAQQGLTDANRAAADAERDLARAREEARQSLEDLGLRLSGARLSLESAQLGVDQARAAWQRMADAVTAAQSQLASAQTTLARAQAEQQRVLADTDATDVQKAQAKANVDAARASVGAADEQAKAARNAAKQADLNYRQAVQRLKEQRLALKRLAAEEKRAAKAGVEGSDQVRAARDRLAQANRRAGEAERDLARARADVARADRQAADQVASARRGLDAANRQAATAAAGLAKPMIQLTVLEQQLAAAWKDLTTVFQAWSRSLQPAVLPTLISGIRFLRDLLPQFTGVVRAAAAGVRELFLRAQEAVASPAFQQFRRFLESAAAPAILGIGRLLGNIGSGLAGLAESFAPVGFAFLDILNMITARFAAFARGLTENPAFQEFTRQFVQMVPMIAQTLSSLGGLVGSVFAALAPAMRPAMQMLTDLSGAISRVLHDAGPSIATLFGAIGGAVGRLAVALAPVLTKLLDTVAPLAVQILDLLVPALEDWLPILGDLLVALAPVISALVVGLKPIITALTPIIGVLADALAQVLLALAPVLPELGVLVGEILAGLLPVIKPLLPVLVDLAVICATVLVVAIRLLTKAVQVLAPISAAVFGGLGKAFKAVTGIIRNAWTKGIKPALDGFGRFLRERVFPAVRDLRDKYVRPVFNTVGNIIRDAWTGIKKIFDRLKGGVEGLGKAFKVGVDTIARVWKGLQDAAKKPVNFVIGTIFNKGIVGLWNTVARFIPGIKKMAGLPTFATGGIYPGWSPGRDIGLAAVSGGEAIMRPEFTRAVGEDFIHSANTAARVGGVGGVARYLAGVGDPGGVRFAGHYFLGGVIDGFKNAAKGFFVGGLKRAADKVFGPLLRLADRTLGGMGGFGELLAGIPRAIIARVRGWFGDNESRVAGGALGVVRAARSQIGLPYSWGGGGRDGPSRGIGTGANTVGFDCSGLTEYAWWRGGKVGIGGTTYAQWPNTRAGARRPGALGFTPGLTHVVVASDRPGQIIQAPYTGALVQEVGDPGGFQWRWPNAAKFDAGGWLPPGVTTVVNATRRAEPVLTDQQWRAVSSAAAGGDGVHYHAHFDGITRGALEARVRAGLQAEMVLAGRRDRTARRK